MRKNLRELLQIIIYIFIYCLFLKIFNITCPIKFLTGISCAGCGMSRAWMSLLTGNVGLAFYYHPLFWTIPIYAVLFLFKDKMSKKIITCIIIVSILLFLGCYIYRMADPTNVIVTCNIKESIIYKLLKGD